MARELSTPGVPFGPDRRRRWLCIAYAFPPINRSGTHRPLGFVRELDRLGWDATVLTVDPTGEPLDTALLADVPESTRILRTRWANLIEAGKRLVGRRPRRGNGVSPGHASVAMPPDHRSVTMPPNGAGGARDVVSELLITPDTRLGWLPPAVHTGLRVCRRDRPDVIYSTSPYMTSHLIALVLRRAIGVPWVADFRDPWRGNPFRTLWTRAADRWDGWLERLVLRQADHVICATPTMTDQLAERDPSVRGRCSTILNGFDAERFREIAPIRPASGDGFVLTHCGQFYGKRSPDVWFEAIRRFRASGSIDRDRVQLVLIGPDTCDGQPLARLAERTGVGDCVHVLGARSHAETLSLMAGSDALALAAASGDGADLQVPGKLFEYLAVRRPIIAACDSASPVIGILHEARAVAEVCAPDCPRPLAEAISRLASGAASIPPDAWAGVDQFERSVRARELVTIFDRLAVRGAAHAPSAVPRGQTRERCAAMAVGPA